MTNSENKSVLTAAGSVNWLSTLITTCFCSYTALVGHRVAPLFSRQALDMLLTGALFTLPYLFMPFLTRYFTSRFSSRNTITFSQLALFLLMGMGTAVLFLVPGAGLTLPWIILLLAMVVLSGMICAAYRSAQRIYIAETVEKSSFPLAGAVTESTTFAGIIAGVTGAAAAAELHFPPGATGIFLLGLAFISLSAATRLRPTLAPLPRLRFSGLPKTWLAVIRREERGRELLLTGIGESYLFGSIIFAASLAVQYITLSQGVASPVLEYAVLQNE